MPENEVTKMKVADLKRELKIRGLATTGNKTELQDRLQTALIDGELLEDADAAISGDEELLTDEEEAKILGADENELLKSPTTTPITADLTTASQAGAGVVAATTDDDILESPITPAVAAKKIVLKRKNSFSTFSSIGAASAAVHSNTMDDAIAKENTKPSAAKVSKMSERHPITIKIDEADKKNEEDGLIAASATAKVSQLSLQERLELRAKKFGVGTKTTTTPGSAAAKATVEGTVIEGDEKQIEMLKKRAERFGCVVSSKIVKLDAEEKLLKRQQRFGADASKSGSSATGTTDTSTPDVWAEKARLRLERFKATPNAKSADTATDTATDPVAAPATTI